MRSVSLRLFLLVCVATMLRADACRAQDSGSLFTPETLTSALLSHWQAESESVPAHRTRTRRTVVARQALAARRPALTVASRGRAPQTVAVAAQLGSRPRFLARSALESAGL